MYNDVEDYYVSNWNLDGKSVEDVISKLQELKTEALNQGYDDLTVDVDYDGYWEFYGVRLETDEEYEKRLKALEKQKATNKRNALIRKQKKEEQDRKEYERLKKKFGDA